MSVMYNLQIHPNQPPLLKTEKPVFRNNDMVYNFNCPKSYQLLSIFLVIVKSSSEGSGSPEGWLWAKTTEAALCIIASLNTSRGWTKLALSVPMEMVEIPMILLRGLRRISLKCSLALSLMLARIAFTTLFRIFNIKIFQLWF